MFQEEAMSMPMSAIFGNSNNNNGNSNNGHEIMFTTQKMLYVKKSAFIFIHILRTQNTNQIYFSLQERSFKIWDINGMFYDVVYEQYKKEFHSQYSTISVMVNSTTET